MKNFLILFSLTFFLISCKKEEEKPIDIKEKYAIDTSDIKTVKLENQNENFFIKYGFLTGKQYSYRLTNIAENINTISMNDSTISQKVKQTLTYLINLKILDFDADSIYEIAFKITSVKLEADVDGEKFFYESETTKDSAAKVRYAEYVSVLNNPFNVRISNIGDLIEIYKADRIINEFVKIKGVADSITAADKDYLKNDMIERALKPLVVQVLRQLTDKVMSKDSAWVIVQEPTRLMVFQIQNTSTYQVKSLELLKEDRIAVIDAALKSNITGNNKVTDRGVTYTFSKPMAHGEGKIYFNLSKGCVQKSKTNSKVQISYTMEVSTAKGIEKGTRSETVINSNVLELL